MSFLFLILMLQCSAVTGQFYSFTVRRGDDITLPCVNVGDDQEKCGKTDWIFVDSENRAQVSLFEFGKITTESNSKSHRLSVTQNCSLVIKKVTDEDVGRYNCRQQSGDSLVDLSVVTMTQDEADNKVTLSCSVSTYRQCRHTVKWQHRRNDYFTDVKTSQPSCSAIVTTSQLTERYDDLLKCAVTDGRGRTSTFSPQFSGDDAMTAKSTTIKSPLSAGTTLTTDPIEQQVTVTGQFPSFTVRDGDDVTLPCGNVRDDQEKCDRTTWLFSRSGNTAAVELVNLGKIKPEFNSKSHRLSVTENCSLVIKKVTDEDVGRYTCRQFYKSGRQQGSDSGVDVSVVTMTEHKDNNKVTLSCSVSKHTDCGHTVKLLFDGNKNDFTDLKTSQHFCSVTATFTSHLNQKTCSESLKCEVTDAKSKKVHQLLFRPQCSGEDAKITTTKSTITETTVTVTNTKTTTNKRNPTKAEGEDAATTRKSSTMESTTTMANNLTPTNSSQTNISDSKTNQVWLLWIIIVTVSLAVLLITGVVWKKTKGKKTPKDENLTDPEDGVFYASISYSKKKKSKAQGRSNNDEGDTVTYSTVKASSSSGGVSTDPTVTYAAINKPKK